VLTQGENSIIFERTWILRTDVDTEPDNMDIDSGDDTDSTETSEELMESQEMLGADLGEDLHMRCLQSLV